MFCLIQVNASLQSDKPMTIDYLTFTHLAADLSVIY